MGFVTSIEISWLWIADLLEFVVLACASSFWQLFARKQLVRFDTKAMAQVTSLHGADNVSITEACRAMNTPEWGVAFIDELLVFSIRGER